MRLIPHDDEREFTSMLRRLLSTTAESARWAALADAGVLGLSLPERYGGSGATLADLGAFSVEAGRHLCPTIVHGTIHAGLVVEALGTDDQRGTLLPELSSGKLSATTALWSPVDAGIVAPVLEARRRGDAWTLHGAVDFVLDAEMADRVVVSGRDATSGRTSVFVVPRESAGLRAETLTLMGARGAARLCFDGVTVDDGHTMAGHGSEVTDERLQRLADTATVLLCLDLVGTSEAALQRTVDHTVMRRQFGRPIASFQAAQHLVANMHIAVAAARLAAWAALSALEEGHPARRQTAVARMHAATAAKSVTLDAHQLHGGIGYVVDTDLHLYSERARVLSTLGGGADIAASWLEDVIT
ncbi:acyl-CoA dehydrogenase [Mycobacterium antarcticum]|uniref:acyl-CoA dehydrogenase family protein n=1 Tax=unclassified Mycolicibacterium TaxID=2636767 RepID=UPI00239F38D0|nr:MULTISPECIES: acyl-CoA dehydrogenase family protein [unclassified Mycolicibacterium]BDX31229.1 acyl-CoA dehydrogenase [Mycolicibacterium sp. TUM20985]GLP80378.1 acyl-CoA dehydrogenase [Mycolicibacterium sp. TUM20984]